MVKGLKQSTHAAHSAQRGTEGGAKQQRGEGRSQARGAQLDYTDGASPFGRQRGEHVVQSAHLDGLAFAKGMRQGGGGDATAETVERTAAVDVSRCPAARQDAVTRVPHVGVCDARAHASSRSERGGHQPDPLMERRVEAEGGLYGAPVVSHGLDGHNAPAGRCEEEGVRADISSQILFDPRRENHDTQDQECKPGVCSVDS
jgi:hypothetical protein